MKAEFKMAFNGIDFDGGLELEDIGTTEALAFMTTALTRLLRDVKGVSVRQGADEVRATAITLHCAELALEAFADEIGKSTVQKAYERNGYIKEKMGE